MSEIIRTAEVIAGEINSIKTTARQTMRAIATSAAVEIGKRLREAKSIVPYGGWGDWLRESVDYSERTAQNLMKLAEESESQSFAPLLEMSYTQAVQLIGLPAGDRAALMEGTDVAELSTRELQELIEKFRAENAEQQTTIEGLRAKRAEPSEESEPKGDTGAMLEDERRARKKAEREKTVAEAKAEAEQKKAAKAENAAKAAEMKNKRYEDELTRLRKLEKEQTKIEEPQAIAEVVKEVVPPEVQEELETLRENERRRKAAEAEQTAAMKREGAEYTFRVLYDLIKSDYQKLKAALEEMAPEAHDKYAQALQKALKIMGEELI